MQVREIQPDEDAICREIGRMVIAFQRLENELLEIAWFCSDSGAASCASLRGFSRIVKHTKRTVCKYLNGAGFPKSAPIHACFHDAFKHASSAASERNHTIHSLYHQYATLHGPPLIARTTIQPGASGSVTIKYETVTEQTTASSLRAVQDACAELFALHKVLMHELPSTRHA
jgi:hypothetical protein